MPAPIDEIIKRRVVQQWLAGDPRPKIAIDTTLVKVPYRVLSITSK